METRESKFESSENMCKHRQNFIIGFVSLHVVLKVFHTELNIPFLRLVLLQFLLKEIFKTVIQKFAIRCE